MSENYLFEQWYEKNRDDLMERFLESHADECASDTFQGRDITELEDNATYQIWVDIQFRDECFD